MKTGFVASVCLAAVASADKTQIDKDMLRLLRNMSNQITNRDFMSTVIAGQVPDLDEYGCWCYFFDNVGRGKGEPVDEIDSFCKQLQEGYECIIRDMEDAGTSCDPWYVPYLTGTGSGKALADHCIEINNGEMCAARACAVEGFFIENMVAYLISSGQSIDLAYKQNNGFDASTDAGCPVKKGSPGASPAKACCGTYPQRYPYKTLDGERGCCGSRTYSTNLLSCCSPGKVKATC